MRLNKNLWLIILLIILSNCSQHNEKKIVDRSGRTVFVKSSVSRVISTAPSNTEIVADLGQADLLVAIDRHSANVRGVPDGLPLLDFFYPDAETIISLEPDLIIASGHNPTGSGEDPFRLLGEAGISVVYIPMSRSIEDIYRDIAFIADLLQVQDRGNELIGALREDIAAITHDVSIIGNKKTVYFEISAAPQMMTFGKNSFINDMISAAGGINIFANDNWLVSPGAESIISRNPDIILTNVNYIDDPVGEIKNRYGFDHISAVRHHCVYRIDTDSSVRPSARITLALRQMVQAIHQAGAAHE